MLRRVDLFLLWAARPGPRRSLCHLLLPSLGLLLLLRPLTALGQTPLGRHCATLLPSETRPAMRATGARPPLHSFSLDESGWGAREAPGRLLLLCLNCGETPGSQRSAAAFLFQSLNLSTQNIHCCVVRTKIVFQTDSQARIRIKGGSMIRRRDLILIMRKLV